VHVVTARAVAKTPAKWFWSCAARATACAKLRATIGTGQTTQLGGPARLYTTWVFTGRRWQIGARTSAEMFNNLTGIWGARCISSEWLMAPGPDGADGIIEADPSVTIEGPHGEGSPHGITMEDELRLVERPWHNVALYRRIAGRRAGRHQTYAASDACAKGRVGALRGNHPSRLDSSGRLLEHFGRRLMPSTANGEGHDINLLRADLIAAATRTTRVRDGVRSSRRELARRVARHRCRRAFADNPKLGELDGEGAVGTGRTAPRRPEAGVTLSLQKKLGAGRALAGTPSEHREGRAKLEPLQTAPLSGETAAQAPKTSSCYSAGFSGRPPI